MRNADELTSAMLSHRRMKAFDYLAWLNADIISDNVNVPIAGYVDACLQPSGSIAGKKPQGGGWIVSVSHAVYAVLSAPSQVGYLRD